MVGCFPIFVAGCFRFFIAGSLLSFSLRGFLAGLHLRLCCGISLFHLHAGVLPCGLRHLVFGGLRSLVYGGLHLFFMVGCIFAFVAGLLFPSS
jgi:hypothetical protein